MNTQNETIVSGETLKKLREADAAEGYAPVPKDLESRARKLLGKRGVISYSNDSKFKNKIARLQNRLNESKRREAAKSPVVVAQLAALERSRA